MYEILFPYRATSTVANGVSTNMVAKVGTGVYGSNAIRALSRGNGGAQNSHDGLNAGSITNENSKLLNEIGPMFAEYNDELMKQGQVLPNIMGANKN